MAKISQVFGDKFLNADAVDKRGRNFTIKAVREETIAGNDKLIMVLKEDGVTETGEYEYFPLNRTNATECASIFNNDDTDEWTEERINLYRDSTMFNGKKVACVRVREATAPAAAAAAAAAAAK